MDIAIPGLLLIPGLRPFTPPPVVQRSVYNSSTHPGTQLIRVLQHNLAYRFEKTHSQFAFMTRQLMQAINFEPRIRYHIADKALCEFDENKEPHLPYLRKGRVIHLHETFLSYVWCITYGLITLYEEGVAKPDQNRQAGQLVARPNWLWMRQAKQLLAYAHSLIANFTPWDTRLPNPEKFDFYSEEWIGKINDVYLYAMTFILQHEFSHAQRQHLFALNAMAPHVSEAILDAQQRHYEFEADRLAVLALRRGYALRQIDGRPVSSQTASELGNLVGLCCLLFLNPSVQQSRSHPGTVARIDAFLQLVNPLPTSGLWGVACVALQAWAQQHGHYLALPPALNTYQDLYQVMAVAASQLP